MRLSEGKPQGEDILLPDRKKKTKEVPSAQATVHMLTNAEGESQEPGAVPEELAVPPRLLSLDAFRGITIVLMLLVNNIATDKWTPDQLLHAPWNGGIRLADLVYPWFLFMIGLAIPFSVASFRRKELPGWRYDVRVLWRAAALVALGIIIDSSIEQRLMFNLGVLQLIGLAYLFGALLYELPLIRRVFFSAVLLAGYWAAIRFLPVPGVGTGVFEDGRNLITYLNTTHLAAVHLQGVLAVVPTTALVLLGTALGDLLQAEKVSREWKGPALLALGILLMALGVVWNLSLPYNKTVWTPSYIVFCAGSGGFLLGVLYLVCDVAGRRVWAIPLAVFGANAILAYVAPILIKTLFLDVWRVGHVTARQAILDFWVGHTNRITGGWLYVIAYVIVCWLGLLILYRRRVFVRL